MHKHLIMKSLRKLIDSIKPHFEPGAKLGAFHSTFEAFESMFFVPDKVTDRGCHIRDAIDLKRTMFTMIIALVPALLFGMWNVGYQHSLAIGENWPLWPAFWFGLLKVLPIIVVSYAVGLSIEFAFAQKRKHQVNEGFLVSGLIIPMLMPVNVPLWMVALATAFAVLIGKEAFGGTGMNIFNPALLARAFLFFAYPSRMSGEAAWVVPSEGMADAFTGATPLAHAAAGAMDKVASAYDLFMGFVPGSIGETSTLAILIGAVLLVATGVASWKIMLSTVVGGMAAGYLFNAVGGSAYMTMPPWQHLLMGGFAFGAVFMATDPVTSAQTECGKWIYGFLVGFMALLIRVLNPAYPEGMMLSILLMNAFAPLIDHIVVGTSIRRRMRRQPLSTTKN